MDIYKIELGDLITPAQGIEIANHFGFEYIVRRVEAQPEMYKDFLFDGCSCLPDEFLGLFTGCKWKDITYLCCLPHDIQYAYGTLGDKKEKKQADLIFHSNLIKKAKMREFLADIFLKAVEIGGSEEFGRPFSWGFANVDDMIIKTFI